MSGGFKGAHPYIPNSAPEIKARMLNAIGVESIEELYSDIPAELRVKNLLDLPPPFAAEQDLRKHVKGLMAKNKSCADYVSFLGAGCYRHYVPAICDEINQRSEFLTAYGGEQYDDFGRFQALFEYTSLLGELLNMDVVNVPTYDGYQAAATAIRMAARITQRPDVLVSNAIGRDKLSKITDYCRSDLNIVPVDFSDGCLDMDDLRSELSSSTAALYFDNPTYFGTLEDGKLLARIAHEHGALCVVGADPISLGVLNPPGNYGADIVCGDIQPLGLHMNYGGGNAGYIATRDEEKFVMEFPSRLFGIVPTSVEGEYGFGDVAFIRTSMAKREKGREFVGTGAALWGITAGVYLALMGPEGMREIGDTILLKTRYAMNAVASVPGLSVKFSQKPHFREFVVNFDKARCTISEVNAELLRHGIFGGLDVSADFPALGASALYCVTEMTSKQDIDRLVSILKKIAS